MTDPARSLYLEQAKARGTEKGTSVLDGKPTKVPGPYVSTPENEARAAEIIRIRKDQARAEHPVHRSKAKSDG
jgi:hypothetical protein